MENKNSKFIIKKIIPLSVVGIEFSASVIAGMAIGYYLDSYFDTKPWFFFFWFICGCVAGVRALLRAVKKYGPEERDLQDKNE